MKALLIAKTIDTDVLREFQVFPYGKIEINGAPPAYFNEQSADLIIRQFKTRGNDMVIDYEHQTLKDVEAPAAGWVKDLFKKPDGLWALTEWTNKATEYLQNKEYRYFSPVFWVNDDRVPVSLVNIALTNSPATNNLKPIIAKMELDADKYETENFRKETNSMLGKLKKLLVLGQDANEDSVYQAVELVVNKIRELEGQGTLVACKEVLDAIGAKSTDGKDAVLRIITGGTLVACKEIRDALGAKESDGKTEMLQLITALKVPGDLAKELSLQVAKLTQQISEIQQEDLVQLALKDGKTSPEELEKWGRNLAKTNPDQFKLIVLSRPAGSVIPLDKIQIQEGARPSVLDESQKEVNRQMGIDDATYKKYNQ